MALTKGMENLDHFQTKYPQLYDAIFDKGRAAGIETGRYLVNSQKGADTGVDLTLEQRAKAAWDNDGALRSEFGSNFDTFSAFLRAEAAGRIGPIVGKKLQNTPGQNADDVSLDDPEKWKAEYEKSADLQKEFKACETYVAYMKGVAAGNVKILGRR